MRKSLEELGSHEDFYCFIGFATNHFDTHREIFQSDFDLLRKYNVRLHFLPRWSEGEKVSFMEMALLKMYV